MASSDDFIKFISCFTVYNGIVLPETGLDTFPIIVYDTTMTAASGCIMNAKLLISGQTEFPDGATVCVLAQGGPVNDIGYLMQALNIIFFEPHHLQLQNAFKLSRIYATGRIISSISRTYDGDVTFDLETISNVNVNIWKWNLRYGNNNDFI